MQTNIRAPFIVHLYKLSSYTLYIHTHTRIRTHYTCNVWKQFCDDLYVFFLPNWHHLSEDRTKKSKQSLSEMVEILWICRFLFPSYFSSLNVCVYLTWIERRKSLMLNDDNHIQFTLKLHVIMKSVIVITRHSYRIGFKNGGKKSPW